MAVGRITASAQLIFISAASSWDYEGPERTFTFTPFDPTSFDTSVSILGDITVEAMEQFIIRVSAPSAESSVQLLENDTIITIMDDDST